MGPVFPALFVLDRGCLLPASCSLLELPATRYLQSGCGNLMMRGLVCVHSSDVTSHDLPMADFKKLAVWQKARKLTVETIRACEDISGSTGSIVRTQLVRAILSVPANIAEGSAKQSDREFRRFVRIALGSITEAESHLIIASDLELVDENDFEHLNPQIEDVRKMLTGLSKRLSTDAGK